MDGVDIYDAETSRCPKPVLPWKPKPSKSSWVTVGANADEFVRARKSIWYKSGSNRGRVSVYRNTFSRANDFFNNLAG